MVNGSSTEINRIVDDSITELLDFQVYEYVKEAKVEVSPFLIKTKAKAKTANIFKVFDVYKDVEMEASYDAMATITNPVKLIRMKY